jgi:O-antigen/teichoic acid export membrane protein
MAAATQRFLNYEMGAGNTGHIKTVFNTSLLIHFIIAIIGVLVAETAGLWFLYNKMNIQDIRIDAVFWVYQLSIVTCAINIISLPYNAAIIAYEKMSAFAYISIFEALGKLLSAYLLLVVAGDRLLLYAIFVCIVQIAVRLLYGWYCKEHFEEIQVKLIWSKQHFKKMFAFAGWNTIGTLSWALTIQGSQILLNMFFGPALNATKGISDQVQSAVSSFVGSFQTAVNPQITKTYAAGEMDTMHNLIFRSSRLSFYIVFIFALPILLETKQILQLWLKNSPDSSVIFVQLSMIVALLSVFANPLIAGNAATGMVKKLMVTVGCINCLIFPLAFIFFKIGFSAWYVLISQIIIVIASFFVRLWIVGRQLKLSFSKYVKETLLQPFFVFVICSPIMYFVTTSLQESFLRLICVLLASVVVIGISVFAVGITKSERQAVMNFVKKKKDY